MTKFTHTILLLSLYSLTTVFGFAHAQTELGVSTNVQYFEYEEFNLNDDSLNQETGILPGLRFLISHSNDKITHTIAGSIHDADVDYDGQTQNGMPHKTDTGTTLYQINYRLNYAIANRVFLHSQINWDHWSRSIHPTTYVQGLDEAYSWPSIDLGMSYTISQTPKHEVMFGASYTKIFEGDFEVDLKSYGAGLQKLNLGQGVGFKSTLSYRYKLDKNINTSAHVFYQSWTFSKSDTKTINMGNNQISFFEPRSDSKRAGLELMLSFLF